MSDHQSSESIESSRLDVNNSLFPSEFDSTQVESFAAMVRAIERAERFTLILAICNTPTRREQLTSALAARFPSSQTLHVSAGSTDPLTEIAPLDPDTKVLFIAGLEYGLTRDQAPDHVRLLSLNQRREDWPRLVHVPVVLWLPEFLLQPLARAAPDFLNWRIGTYSFVEPKDESHKEAETYYTFSDHGRIPAQERSSRIDHLQNLIASYSKPGLVQDQAVTNWQLELSKLWISLGQWDDAQEYLLETFLPSVQAANDKANEAEALVLLGTIGKYQGNYSAALESFEKAKQLFSELKIDRDIAVTRGKIADVLQARGELDEALRIRKEEELPVYQRLGDVRSEAVTRGKIADVLQARGELEEALRIRKEEELPVYQRLGDLHSEAVTQGLIADVLQTRGELEEALHIRKKMQLLVYQRLGDVRSEAITQGQIADVLQTRGELDEALRIRKELQLPVFQRLGDVRSEAITQGQIADVLQTRGELDEALRIRKELQLPVFQRLGDVRSEAVTQCQIADVLQVRGHKGDREEARTLLHSALETCEKLRIPEAEVVRDIIKKHGLE